MYFCLYMGIFKKMKVNDKKTPRNLFKKKKEEEEEENNHLHHK